MMAVISHRLAHGFGQGLVLSQRESNLASSAWCMADLGSVAAHGEAPERAARLWGAAEQLRQALGCRSAPAARTTYERAKMKACTQLGEDTFVMAWQQGRALSLEQAIAEALQLESIALDSSLVWGKL